MVNKYMALLDTHYDDCFVDDGESSKLAFLADYVFDFTTYDDDIGEEMATDMLYVLSAIWQGKTFGFIADKANYRKYLTMINMPFLANIIEWGTSIRGAWLDDCKDVKVGCLFTVPRGELRFFIQAVIVWGLSETK